MGAYVGNSAGESMSMRWGLVALLLYLGKEHGWIQPGCSCQRTMMADDEAGELGQALRVALLCAGGDAWLPVRRRGVIYGLRNCFALQMMEHCNIRPR